MKSEVIVSVIIPVYNSESFLKRCLESITRQSFEKWEAICVDDGSTDKSGTILDELAVKDHRIKVIHKVNEGVSVARNAGIKYAVGKYLCFVDSDDFLHPDTFRLCVELAEKNRADIVAYTYNRTYRTKMLLRQLFPFMKEKEPKFPDFGNNPSYLLTSDIYHYATEYSQPHLPAAEKKWAVKHCQPWRALYRHEMIADIKFLPGIMYEDFPWWGEVLLKVKKAVILNLPLYYYYPNRLSYIMSSDNHFRIESLKRAIAYSENLYAEKADSYQREMWHKNFIVPFKRKLEKKLRGG